MINKIAGKIKLNDGQEMPGYGFGCYKAFGPELAEAVKTALECGYRYIDSAAFYENEKTVGEGLKAGGVPHREIFVLSKIWPTAFANAPAALDRTLKELGLEYLDGYLLHWPGLDEDLRHKAFEALLKEKEKGKIHVLGVSNFLADQLEKLHERFGIWPAINQIEVQPLFQNLSLRAFCQEKGIQVVSWSPLGRGHAMNLPVIVRIAGELRKTPAQIILRWAVQHNLIPIPKSIHPERIKENAEVFDFALNPADMAAIDSLNLPNEEGKIGKDPRKFPPLA